MAPRLTKLQSKMKVEEVMDRMGWNSNQYKRFLFVTGHVIDKLLDTDDYWTEIPKPKPLVWDAIPIVVQEQILQDVNSGLVKDPIVANLDVVEWRFRPVLLRRSKQTPPSRPGDPPVAPPPQPADPMAAPLPLPLDPPEPNHSQPSRFWDPIAAALRAEDREDPCE